MKEMNDIENLFGSSFGGEEITPPNSVKANIDKELFSGGRGGIIKLWPVMLLLLIGIIAVTYFIASNGETNSKNEQHLSISTDKNSTEERLVVNELTHTKTDSALQPSEDLLNVKSPLVNNRNSSFSNNAILLETAYPTMKSESSRMSNASDYRDVEQGVIEEIKHEATNSDQSNFVTIQNVENQNFEHHNSEQSNQKEARGIDITSNLETLPLSAIDQPDAHLQEQAYAPKMASNRNLMDIRFYAGFNSGISNVVSTIQPISSVKRTTISESSGLNLGAEFGYHFNGRIGITGGIEYSASNSEVMEHDTTGQVELVDEYWAYIYNNPVTQDSIIDSNYVYEYGWVSSDITNTSMVKSQSFSLPVYLNYNIPVGTKMNLGLYTGARLNFLNQKFIDDNGAILNPKLSKFSLSVMFRPELTYQFNKFGVGLYGRFGYDVKPGMHWETMRRNRFEVGGGLVLKYRF